MNNPEHMRTDLNAKWLKIAVLLFICVHYRSFWFTFRVRMVSAQAPLSASFMGVSFFLDKRKGYPATQAVSVRMRLTWHRARRISVSLPIKIQPRHWNAKRSRLRASAPGAALINGQLDDLLAYGQWVMLQGATNEEAEALLLEKVGRVGGGVDLGGRLAAFIGSKERRASSNTVKTYRTLEYHFAAWYKGGHVTRAFLDEFQDYLLGQGLRNSSINKLVSCLKTYLRWLHKRGEIDQVPTARALPQEQKAVLYLTGGELGRLMAVPLGGQPDSYEDVRTLFFFQCMTGQRYGDIKGIEWEHITGDLSWWNLHTEKTNVTKRVPIPTPAQEILRGRQEESYPLPRMSITHCNAVLKQLARLAGLDTPVTVVRQSGGYRETETKPKWQLITTHVARKTFVTLFLQGGGTLVDLLGLTHKDLKTIKRYAGVDDDKRRRKVERIMGSLQ